MAFASHEALNQSGALLGPLLVALVVATSGFHLAFALLAIPGILALAAISWLRFAVPHPAGYEQRGEQQRRPTQVATMRGFSPTFWRFHRDFNVGFRDVCCDGVSSAGAPHYRNAVDTRVVRDGNGGCWTFGARLGTTLRSRRTARTRHRAYHGRYRTGSGILELTRNCVGRIDRLGHRDGDTRVHHARCGRGPRPYRTARRGLRDLRDTLRPCVAFWSVAIGALYDVAPPMTIAFAIGTQIVALVLFIPLLRRRE